METKNKELYDAPATTVVEVKMETGVLITSTTWVIIGTEGGVSPTDGIQSYTLDSDSKNW